MSLSYDKAALLEYIDDISGVGEQMRRSKDESFGVYHSCKQQYTRLYTELEQAARKAYNRVESAESMRRTAEAEYEFALRRLDNAEDDNARAEANHRLVYAQSMCSEAEAELSRASAAYSTAQGNLKKITDVWGKYQLKLESAANRVGEGLSSFSTIVSNGNRDLGEYMSVMDKAEAELYGGGTAAPTQSTSGGQRSASVSGSTRSRGSDANAFRSGAGNTLHLAAESGAAVIVMTLSGVTHTFPGTKSGSAKAYRTALKSGDSEMIQKTKALFTDGIDAAFPGLPGNGTSAADTQKAGHPKQTSGSSAASGESKSARQASDAVLKEYQDDNGQVYRTGDRLLPDKSFEVNGYQYETDGNGRIACAEGKIYLGERGAARKMDSMEAVSGGDALPSDERGHLIAHRFGGSDGIENLIPMDFDLNHGDYYRLENTLAAAAKDEADVHLKVEPVYADDTRRPVEIRVTYSIDGEKETVVFKNGGTDNA